MENFFSQEMIAFLVSRHESPNKIHEVAGFVCGEKYKGFKRLKSPLKNEYTHICEILFNSLRENNNKTGLTHQEQYSVNVAGRLAFLMAMASLYNGEQGNWKEFKDALVESGVKNITSENLINWISDNTKNTKENGKIYYYIATASDWGILRTLNKNIEEIKSSLVKKIKP